MDDFHLLKKYVGSYRNPLIIVVILSIVCGFFQMVSLGALVPLINIIATGQEPTGNLWNILKTGLGYLNIPLNITTLLLILSIIFITGQLLVFLRQSIQIELRFLFTKDLKERLLFQLLHTDMAYFNNKKTGYFQDTILTETERAGSGLFVITDMFSNICLILVYVLMLLYISVEMTIYCIIIVIAMLFLVNKLLQKSKIYGIKTVESNTEIHEYISERLNLIKLIKSNSTEDVESGVFEGVVARFRNANTQFVINGARIELFFQSIMFIVAIVIVYLSMMVFHLTVGLIVVFLFVLVMLTTPLRSINNQRHDMTMLMASLQNVDSTLTEAKAATSISEGQITFTGVGNKIEMRSVAYNYTPGRSVLQDINFAINKNEFVALVGPSGGGKSTLVDLLMRLIDPTVGSILIDGKDLKDFNTRSYHAKVGLVSQDIFIFNESVLFNICYGADEISLERAKTAATIAYAHDFIEQLPQGYETHLGDRGVKLSGGQKQRIALARAIYKNPDILILDEATSALDTESERIIQNSINTIKHQYTIIVVAHRISTIQDADTIVVIEGGRIVEKGTYQELLSKNGTFARYSAMQHGKKDQSLNNE
jgi:ATP-binding cassette, subfamily B, bacterial MsbA